MIRSAVDITAVRAFTISILIKLECCVRTQVFDVFCEKLNLSNLLISMQAAHSPFPSTLYLFESTELKLRLLFCTRTAG